jgi:hypothetical protein
LLNGVQIRTVSGEEDQSGTCLSDCIADSAGLVTSQIVHHNDVAWAQAWYKNLLDIAEEALAIDRTIEDAPGLSPDQREALRGRSVFSNDHEAPWS